MAMKCICPHCKKELSIGEEFAGQPMQCPMCRTMFQSPSVAPAPAGAYGGTPFWQAQAGDANAPEWPWLMGKKPTGAESNYDWGAVKQESGGLPQSWHLVWRGFNIIPGGMLVAFGAAAVAAIFNALFSAEFITDTTLRIILLVCIPMSIIGALIALVGLGLCCAVPKDSGVKTLAMGAGGSCFVAFLASLFGLFLTLMSDKVEGGFSTFLNVMGYIGFVVAIVAGLVGGAAFIMFMRGVSLAYANKRLGQRLFWFLFVIAGFPVAALMVWLLFRATAAVLELEPGSYTLVLTVGELILAAVLLGGFLLMMRDVKGLIERVVLPAKG